MLSDITLIGLVDTKKLKHGISVRGEKYLAFDIITNPQYKKYDVFECFVTGDRAELIAGNFGNRQPICVKGTLKVNRFENAAGIKNKIINVVIDRVIFILSKEQKKKLGFATMKEEGLVSWGEETVPQHKSQTKVQVAGEEDDIPFG